MAKQEVQPDWHSLPINEVLKRSGASSDPLHQGLSQAEAERRLRQNGLNRLTPQRQQGPVIRFLLQFHSLLIYVLMSAALLTVVLGHYTDAAVIAAVVLLNAIIGFIQEGKAERALAAIGEMLSPKALVLRDGSKQSINAEQLVIGDSVQLNPGDRVPADIRLLQAFALRADEALLTGEAVPSSKQLDAAPVDAVLGDRHCMLYSGSLITGGTATGVVIAIGDESEIGRINRILGNVEQITTPLLKQMSQFGRQLTLAIVVLAAATVMFGTLIHNYSAAEMFLASVGLAVAAIPEGLPAIMTVTLALGVQRMVQRNAIIRRLPSVETLGSVTVICSDKTGTLTLNEMMVQSVTTACDGYQVSGNGYSREGKIERHQSDADLSHCPELASLLQAGLLCNDASLEYQQGQWTAQGDPTEVALITLALKGGLDIEQLKCDFRRLAAIPFESESRFMATLHKDQSGRQLVYVKGAPERMLQLCGSQRTNGEQQPLDRDYWEQKMQAMARLGQRVLAIGEWAMPPTADELDLRSDSITGKISMLGLVGIIDPPRPEAMNAVATCHQAGIRVKMMTGDHALTAVSIGNQLGIGDGNTVITGQDIDRMSQDELRQSVTKVDVFARTSPEHKLQLVQALQTNGQVLAMTGDGVNDAPSLKQADIGIAMGNKGTEVAKEASEMVLTDDNFATIANAVGEGRAVYDNLKKAILFILPTNGGEALTILAAILLGMSLPITPVQILWVNMITAVTLALAFAFEPPEANLMQRQPRRPSAPLLSSMLVWRIALVSLILVAGTFGSFYWYYTQGASLELSRTIAVNTLVVFEIFYLFNTRSLHGAVLNRAGLLGNPIALYAIAVLMIFQLAFTYAGPMQALFDTEAMSIQQWLVVMAVASSVLWLVELEKWLARRAVDNKPDA